MSMPAPPAQHGTGDTGHTGDHNTLAAIAAALETAVQALQATAGNIFSVRGGNACPVPGTATSFATVTVTAGNRDGGADLFDFYYGTQKIFSLNSYGELRITAAQLTHVAQIIYVLANQSADAWQVLSPGLTPLARVDPAGNATFAGQVSLWTNGAPSAWVHAPLQNGWTTYSGRTLAVKLTNDNMVQISGQIVPGQTGNSSIVANLPAGFAPLFRPEPVMAAYFNYNSPGAGLYFEAETNSTLQIFSYGGTLRSNAHIVIAGRYPLDAQ